MELEESGSLSQTVLQSYSNQDSMVLAQKQKYRSMEQDRKPSNRSGIQDQLEHPSMIFLLSVTMLTVFIENDDLT